MHESRIRDRRQSTQEFAPYSLLFVFIVSPKSVLNSLIAGTEANADQVVEIAVGQAFDIQIDGGAVELRVQKIDDMDLVLADCESPSTNDEISPLTLGFSAASTRTKCIGQLGNREDSLAVKPFAFLVRHPG